MVLVEREEELAGLIAVLEAATGGDGLVAIVEGEAGIGKTSLVQAAVDRARQAGIHVLVARGAELERGFGFGVARQLLEPLLRGFEPGVRADLLSGDATPAAAALGLASGPGAPRADDRFAVYHGLYGLMANIAAAEACVLVVDDAQWSDEESLGWLAFTARRLGGLRLGIVLGWRTGEPGAPEEAYAQLASNATRIVPRTLSREAVAGLIRQRPGAPSDLGFCLACHEATGGNPFLLEQLLDALAAGEINPTVEGARRVGELGPATVTASVLARLGRLGDAAAALARAVAVFDSDAELAVAAAVSQLPDERALEAAEALVRAGILAGGEHLRFAHPILRASVYQDLAVPRRAALHRRAGRVLHDLAGDPDRAALHLAAALPAGDQWVAERLMEAAQRATRRGTPADAIAFLERALREPVPAERRAAALVALGQAARQAGRADAEERLREALAAAGDEIALLAESAAALALVLWNKSRADEAHELLEGLVDRLGADHRDLAHPLLILQANIGIAVGAPAHAIEARLERIRAEASDGSPAELIATGLLAYHLALLHRAMPAGLLDRVLSRLDALAAVAADPTQEHMSIQWIAYVVIIMGGPDGGLFDAMVDGARARGSTGELASALRCRAVWRQRHGLLVDADSDARAGLDLAGLIEQDLLRAWAVGGVAHVIVERGEVEEADGLLARHGWADGDVGPTISEIDLCIARASLRLAQGDASRARADVDRWCAWFRARGPQVPLGNYAVLITQILLADGDCEAALALASAELTVAMDYGRPAHLGRARLSVALATEGPPRIELFAEAVAALEAGGSPLDLARGLIAYGSVLRRAGRRSAARAPLEQAMEIAHRCGARPLLATARTELAAVGARPRRPRIRGVDALTASERRVVELAAAGRSNPEIAQLLFITRSTVEAHLSSSYRKLGVPARSGLADALSEAAPAPAGHDHHETTVDGVLLTLLAGRIMSPASASSISGGRNKLDAVAGVVDEALLEHDGRRAQAPAEAAFLATFASPAGAVRAATTVRERVKDHGLSVGAGLHAGEVVVHDTEVHGPAVAVAVRIARRANPGDILLSGVVRDLFGRRPALTDRGEELIEGQAARVEILSLSERLA